MSDLSVYLRTKRHEKGHSLRDAAKASGLSASVLSRIENDIGAVKTITLRKVAAYCEVPFVELVLMENVPEMSQEETDAYLIAHGYNLERLRQEINALIDELSEATKSIWLKGVQA